MKILICQISVITVLLTACSKQEDQSTPAVAQKPAPAPAAPAPEAPKPVADAVTAAKDTAPSVANDATKAADTVKNEAAAAPATASTGFQAWTDKVKGLISQQKYTEALAAFSELPSSLTPEQQKLVDQLKAQVQQSLSKQTADQGLKAVGGLLNNTKK